jgi:hypothetical protein
VCQFFVVARRSDINSVALPNPIIICGTIKTDGEQDVSCPSHQMSGMSLSSEDCEMNKALIGAAAIAITTLFGFSAVANADEKAAGAAAPAAPAAEHKEMKKHADMSKHHKKETKAEEKKEEKKEEMKEMKK